MYWKYTQVQKLYRKNLSKNQINPHLFDMKNLNSIFPLLFEMLDNKIVKNLTHFYEKKVRIDEQTIFFCLLQKKESQ